MLDYLPLDTSEELPSGFSLALTINIEEGTHCLFKSLRSGVWHRAICCDSLCPGGFIRVLIAGKKQMIFHTDNLAIPI